MNGSSKVDSDGKRECIMIDDPDARKVTASTLRRSGRWCIWDLSVSITILPSTVLAICAIPADHLGRSSPCRSSPTRSKILSTVLCFRADPSKRRVEDYWCPVVWFPREMRVVKESTRGTQTQIHCLLSTSRRSPSVKQSQALRDVQS